MNEIMNKIDELLKQNSDIKEELNKILAPKKAAKFAYLSKISILLTGSQLEMYNKMYPTGVPKYIDVAISQVEATLKRQNNTTELLNKDIYELRQKLVDSQVELEKTKRELKEERDNLREAEYEIKILSTPQNVSNAEIQIQLDMLAALESAGVDNWSGYDWAMEIFRGNSNE